MSTLKKILLEKQIDCKSIWFMRQAGRYLPEFRKIRSQNKNFIKLCFDSNLSSEISLQPINRFDLDSAIIFSDILLVPYVLGQDVKFVKDVGPIVNKFELDKFLSNDIEEFSRKMDPVYRAIEKTRKKLNKNKSLISFIGAPWTLLTYMLGKKNKDGKKDFLKDKKKTNLIIKDLIKYLCLHIKNQINSGSDVVQIFDSWAGLLDKNDLHEFCFKPNYEIVKFCKKNKIPVICFPRGIGSEYLNFNKEVQPDALNIDYEIDPKWARENLKNVVLQGGMHPQFLLKSEEKIYTEAKKYLDIFKDVPYIFNLGHGLVPETNPEKLKKLIEFVRQY